MAQLNYRIEGTLNGGPAELPFQSASAAINWAIAAGVTGAKFMKLVKGQWIEDTEKSQAIAKGVHETAARFATSEALKGLSGMVKKGALSSESLAEQAIGTLKNHGVSLTHIMAAVGKHYPTVSALAKPPEPDTKPLDGKPVEQPQKTGILGLPRRN